MIQMCVYNSILLVDWRLLAGCTGRLLAGPGKAGWPLGRLDGPWEGCYCWLHWEAAGWCVCSPCTLLVLLIFTDFADFCWSPSLGDDADFSGYGVDMTYGTSLGMEWICFTTVNLRKPIWLPVFKCDVFSGF